jgi:hypothetical protein
MQTPQKQAFTRIHYFFKLLQWEKLEQKQNNCTDSQGTNASHNPSGKVFSTC